MNGWIDHAAQQLFNLTQNVKRLRFSEKLAHFVGWLGAFFKYACIYG